MILPAIPTILTVVVSRGHSRNPEKRAVEAAIVEAATGFAGVRVLDLPHLYDLKADTEAIQTLLGVEGEMLVASWLYPRATHWLLDRIGVRGQVGQTSFDELPDDDDEEEMKADGDDETRVTDLFPRQGRTIYSLDMRAGDGQKLAAEVRRIAEQVAQQAESDGDQAITLTGPWTSRVQPGTDDSQAAGFEQAPPVRLEDSPTRRWYPVIDYSKCTNCMECIDFCLFGVYGIDGAETILVEQPDNCRKGCPACSRVCPANAIIFPQHKAPAIAGAPVEGEDGFKIDLSLLFGAPDQTADPIAVAARERDEQLLLAGRAAVGMPQSRRAKSKDAAPDHLDDLIDQLDQCEL
jgi:NAD-dependent dihydropyrimidine dehydrogenase PreA subunit